MNKLPGEIKTIQTEGSLSLLTLSCCGSELSSIVIDTPETADYLREGARINILFKENEVVIAGNFKGKISSRNIFECKIKEIREGKLLSEISLDFKGNPLKSIITTASCKSMNLKPDDMIKAMVKTNEIIIGYDD